MPSRRYRRYNDEIAKDSGFSLFEERTTPLSNALGLDGIEIVVSKTMKSLYADLTSDVLPHGTGKTTTIYWLYWQFVDNCDYKVCAFSLKLEAITTIFGQLQSQDSQSQKNVLLCDPAQFNHNLF